MSNQEKGQLTINLEITGLDEIKKLHDAGIEQIRQLNNSLSELNRSEINLSIVNHKNENYLDNEINCLLNDQMKHQRLGR